MPACRFETPGASSAAERLAAVAAMIYLVFNEGYSAPADATAPRAALCDEAIRLARLLLRVFPSRAGDHGPDGADAAAAGPRAPRASTPTAAIVLLEDQDRACGTARAIAEGLALIDKAMRHRRPGPYQVQAAIAALHARAAHAAGHRLGADRPALRQPRAPAALAGGDAQPRRGGQQGARPGRRARDDRTAGHSRLAGYFYFHGVKGALLQQLDRRDEARAPSTGRSRSPIRRPRPRISASISIISTRRVRRTQHHLTLRRRVAPSRRVGHGRLSWPTLRYAHFVRSSG